MIGQGVGLTKDDLPTVQELIDAFDGLNGHDVPDEVAYDAYMRQELSLRELSAFIALGHHMRRLSPFVHLLIVALSPVVGDNPELLRASYDCVGPLPTRIPTAPYVNHGEPRNVV